MGETSERKIRGRGNGKGDRVCGGGGQMANLDRERRGDLDRERRLDTDLGLESDLRLERDLCLDLDRLRLTLAFACKNSTHCFPGQHSKQPPKQGEKQR